MQVRGSANTGHGASRHASLWGTLVRPACLCRDRPLRLKFPRTLQTYRSLVDLQDEQKAEVGAEMEPSSSELLRRLHSAHAEAGFAAALDEFEGLHRRGQADGEGLETDGRGTRAGARTLAANVPWLEANPDAHWDLARAPPGAVSPPGFAKC